MKPVVFRSSYPDTGDLPGAVAFARSHAETGLQTFPFDVVYCATVDQSNAMDAWVAANGGFKGFKGTGVDLGLMAAKELGGDEQAFAHALSSIQRCLEADGS